LKKTILALFVGVFVIPITQLIGFLVVYQVGQRTAAKARLPNTLQGIVTDQDGQPISGVRLTYIEALQYHFYPLPYSPSRWLFATNSLTNSTDGTFSIPFRGDSLGVQSVAKPGYSQEGHTQRESSWRRVPPSYAHTTRFELYRQDAVQKETLEKREFRSMPFPSDGRIYFNLIDGTYGTAGNADLMFQWHRLKAATNHGEYGKWTIRAGNGGIRLAEGEKLFAPRDGYEDGVVFFFDPKSIGGYMKFSRVEFFLKSREGSIYARVYAQLDRAAATISVRARINRSGTPFIDNLAENYAIGVYGSLSGYSASAEPWWSGLWPEKGQVLITEARIRELINGDDRYKKFTRHFAGYYGLPGDILENVARACIDGDLEVTKQLAKNVSVPTNIMQRVAATPIPWVSETIRSTLATLSEVKQFLTLEQQACTDPSFERLADVEPLSSRSFTNEKASPSPRDSP